MEWTDYGDGGAYYSEQDGWMRAAARYRSTLSVRLRALSPAAGKSRYVTICRHSSASVAAAAAAATAVARHTEASQ